MKRMGMIIDKHTKKDFKVILSTTICKNTERLGEIEFVKKI